MAWPVEAVASPRPSANGQHHAARSKEEQDGPPHPASPARDVALRWQSGPRPSTGAARARGAHQREAAATFDSLALDRAGTGWAWGANDSGQLGNGSACTDRTPARCTSAVPVRVRGLAGVVAIAGGASRAVALTRAGTVWTWGFNLT